MTHTGNTPSGLHFYQSQAKKGEETSHAWGQLAGSVHRLRALVDELDVVSKVTDVRTLVPRLTLYAEMYLFLAYQHRERLLGLVRAVTGCSKDIIESLKHSAKRTGGLSVIERTHSTLAHHAEEVLKLLEEDVFLRNKHTHDQYLRLGLFTESGVFDPIDALNDVEGTGQQKGLEERIREEAGQLANRYGAKAAALAEITEAVLEGASPTTGQRAGTGE